MMAAKVPSRCCAASASVGLSLVVSGCCDGRCCSASCGLANIADDSAIGWYAPDGAADTYSGPAACGAKLYLAAGCSMAALSACATADGALIGARKAAALACGAGAESMRVGPVWLLVGDAAAAVMLVALDELLVLVDACSSAACAAGSPAPAAALCIAIAYRFNWRCRSILEHKQPHTLDRSLACSSA